MRAKNRIIKFPYKPFRGLSSPIIPIQINGVTLDAYVDSGAMVSLFSSKEAEAIGLKWRSGKPGHLTVGSGTRISVYFHRLTIRLGPAQFKAVIGFSSQLGVGYNLLGRRDIFSRFIVTFNDSRGIITFRA